MEYYVLSKQGSREINEDCAGIRTGEDSFLCVLADGLGGHGKGEVASRTAVETSIELYAREGIKEGIEPFLHTCFTRSQEQVRDLQKSRRAEHEMKTTMVALAGARGQLQWGHIGDSRLYYFKDGRLICHTPDHSVPWLLVRAGELKESQIRHHEDRNRLLRVIGTEWEHPMYELAESVSAEEGQAFLLCSDGFWEWIEEKQMVKLLRRADSPEMWLKEMEAVVLKNGSGKDMDNYTAAGIFIGENKKRKKVFGLF